jgi:hypothetical protein
MIDNVLYKLCTKCNKWFICTEEYFYKNNTKSASCDGLFPYCKKCNIKKSSNWELNHKKELSKYFKEYYKNNVDIESERRKKWNDFEETYNTKQ